MLRIEKLVAGYGKVQVLQGIDLEVPDGKLVTLIGSNGAGKTTTLRALSGMIRPESGSITLGGRKSPDCQPTRSPGSAWLIRPRDAVSSR